MSSLCFDLQKEKCNLTRSVFIPSRPEASSILGVEQLSIKLENAQNTVRKLNAQMGSTVVSSTSDSGSSGSDVPDVAHTAEQVDFEFGRGFSFTTNVSSFYMHLLKFQTKMFSVI